MIIDIFNFSLTAILIGVSCAWVFLIRSMMNSFRLTPYLDKFETIKHDNPKVSIILPARNEEEFLARCLDSLIDQDYSNYEIIIINSHPTIYSTNFSHRPNWLGGPDGSPTLTN